MPTSITYPHGIVESTYSAHLRLRLRSAGFHNVSSWVILRVVIANGFVHWDKRWIYQGTIKHQ